MKNIVVMKLVDFDDDHYNLKYFDNNKTTEENELEEEQSDDNETKNLATNDNLERTSKGLNKKNILIKTSNSNLLDKDESESEKKNLVNNKDVLTIKNDLKRSSKRFKKKESLMEHSESKLLLKNMLSKHFTFHISKKSLTIDNIKFSDYKPILHFLTTNKIIKIKESDLLKLKAIFKNIKVPIKYMGKLAKKILLQL